jgi:hypothetical protein
MQARLLTVPWTSAEEEQAQSWACFFHGTRGHKTSVQQEHKSLQETFRQSSLRKTLQTFFNKCNQKTRFLTTLVSAQCHLLRRRNPCIWVLNAMPCALEEEEEEEEGKTMISVSRS